MGIGRNLHGTRLDRHLVMWGSVGLSLGMMRKGKEEEETNIVFEICNIVPIVLPGWGMKKNMYVYKSKGFSS